MKLDAVISGSFAIQFFDRVEFPDSDLDIFIGDGEKADLLGQHLINTEKYVLQVPRMKDEETEGEGYPWEDDKLIKVEYLNTVLQSIAHLI